MKSRICASTEADNSRYKAKYCIQGGNFVLLGMFYRKRWGCKNTEGYRRSKENTVIRSDVLGKYWIFLTQPA